MTDPTGWQQPGPPRPRYGEYAPERWQPVSSPAGGPPPPGPLPGPGWTPPPRPGLIPLRPLGFGELLSSSFLVLRRNPKATFGAALLIEAIVLLGTLLVTGSVVGAALLRISDAAPGAHATVRAGSIVAIALSALVPVVLGLVAGALLQGIVVREVAQGALGRRLSAGGLWRGLRGRRWALIGFAALLAAALTVVLGALALVVVLLALAGSLVTTVIAAIVGVLGGLGAVVLGVWVYVKLLLVPSAIALERVTVWRAVARSWSLTRGAFWRAFGAQLIVVVACGVATQVVETPVALLYTYAVTLILPGGSGSAVDTGHLWLGIVSYALLLLVGLLAGAITQVISSATGALVYVDQRMRREGLDLVLVRYLDEVQAGGEPADPFEQA